MPIIRTKNVTVLSMPELSRMILKFIYDRENFTLAEEKQMVDSIHKWKKAIKLEDEKLLKINEHEVKNGLMLTTDHKYSMHKDFLRIMAGWLKEDADGKLENRKLKFKAMGIDYRKFFRLSEAYNPEDFARAEAQYKEYALKNPEQEGLKFSPETRKLF